MKRPLNTYEACVASAIRHRIVPGDVVRVDAARPRWWNLLGWWRWWRRPKVSGCYRVVSVTETTFTLK